MTKGEIAKITILLVDKRSLFREGLAMILNREHHLKVLGICSSGNQAVEKASQLQPDIVIIDTEIENCHCVEAIHLLSELRPKPRIIILTHSEQEEELSPAFMVGANAYINKDVEVKDLITEITQVNAGEVVIYPPIAEKMLKEFALLQKSKEVKQRSNQIMLTKRESEVLNLVASGAANRGIAGRLFVSEHTVKAHLSHILGKMQAHNRQQASALAIAKGMVNIRNKPDK